MRICDTELRAGDIIIIHSTTKEAASLSDDELDLYLNTWIVESVSDGYMNLALHGDLMGGGEIIKKEGAHCNVTAENEFKYIKKQGVVRGHE